MNKIVITAVFIFWTAVSIFYANSLFNKDEAVLGQQKSNQVLDNINNTQLSTLAIELPSHNLQSDCWLAINGKVYDVTKYISSHPGGAQQIIKYCGQEATEAFATMDKANPRDHSQSAYQLLENYYIGELNSVPAPVDAGSDAAAASNVSTDNNAGSSSNPAASAKPTTSNLSLTAALVSQHSLASDCWVTAGNNVYNVTSYIKSHPGGQSNITRYCGQDIAAAFASQGHSANASSIFASYKIGTIGSTVSSDVVNTAPANTNQNNTNTWDNGGEWEDEDD